MNSRQHPTRGLTLTEVIVASVLLALIVGGAMLAVAASMKHSRSSVEVVDVAELAQQTAERLRNRIACDDGVWFGSANCAPQPVGSTADPIPLNHPILNVDPTATRAFEVVPFDCDGDSVAGDCMQVKVTVTHQPPQ